MRASLQVAPSTPPKYPQRPSTPPTPPRAGPMWQWGQRTFLYLRRQWANGSSCASAAFLRTAGPPPTTALDLGRSTLRLRASLTIHGSGRAWLHEPSRQSGIVPGRGPGSAGQGDDVVFANAATPGGSSGFSSSGADSRASGIIDDGAFAGTSSSSAIGGVGYHASPRREASPPPSPR